MNTGLVLLALIVAIYGLMNGMIWLALGGGVIMVFAAGTGINKQASASVGRNFVEDDDWAPDEGAQTLQILNWPGWEGKQWWEVFGIAHGQGLGKLGGMLK